MSQMNLGSPEARERHRTRCARKGHAQAKPHRCAYDSDDVWDEKGKFAGFPPEDYCTCCDDCECDCIDAIGA